NWSEDTGAAWLVVVLDDDGSVLIEGDVRTVCTTGLLLGANDNSLDDFARLYVAAWGCFLDSGDDDVTNASKTSGGSTENADAQNFACTSVVGDLQTRFLLNHYWSPDLD